MEKQKVTPYRTKTGIQIGQYYERKQIWEASYDMELLQEALLIDNNILRREKLRNLIYAATLGFVLFICFVAK